MNYDEESENEMIQLADLTDLKPLAEDEKRYKSLHSHVKYYNEHNAENEKQYSNVFYMQPYAEEIFNLQEERDKPFIAGFKHELDKVECLTGLNIFPRNYYNYPQNLCFQTKVFLSIFKIVKQTTVAYITPIKTINNISFHNKRSIQNLRRLQNYITVTTGIF